MKILRSFVLLSFTALAFAACSSSKGTTTAGNVPETSPEPPVQAQAASQKEGKSMLTTSPTATADRDAAEETINRVEYVK